MPKKIHPLILAIVFTATLFSGFSIKSTQAADYCEAQSIDRVSSYDGWYGSITNNPMNSANECRNFCSTYMQQNTYSGAWFFSPNQNDPNCDCMVDPVTYQQNNGTGVGGYCSASRQPPPPDTTPPSQPTDFTAEAISSSSIQLSWTASTDTVGVVAYLIYRDGSQIDSVGDVSYYNTGLNASTTYSYFVKARDAAGNLSIQSETNSATTRAYTPPPPNSPPTVAISSPNNGASFQQNASVAFTGSAYDKGDRTPSLVWVSSRDGQIGTGGSFSKSNLSVGAHNITATAPDSEGGPSGSRSISITISSSDPTTPTITRVLRSGSLTANSSTNRAEQTFNITCNTSCEYDIAIIRDNASEAPVVERGKSSPWPLSAAPASYKIRFAAIDSSSGFRSDWYDCGNSNCEFTVVAASSNGEPAGLVQCGPGYYDADGKPIVCDKGEFYKLISRLFKYAIFISGIAVVLSITVGGFFMLISAGSEEKLSYAKRTITAAVVGLIVVLTGWMIVNTVITSFTKCEGKWYVFEEFKCGSE